MRKREVIRGIKRWLGLSWYYQGALCPFEGHEDKNGILPHKICMKYFSWWGGESPCPCHNHELEYVVKRAKEIIKELESQSLLHQVNVSSEYVNPDEAGTGGCGPSGWRR